MPRPALQITPLRTAIRASARELLGRIAPRSPVEVISPEEVRTPRLTLRPLVESDREAFIRLVRTSLDHLTPWVPLHNPGESDDAFFDRQLAHARTGDETGQAWRRVGALADGRLVGAFHLNAITRGLSWHADAVWWVGAAHTRRGLASEGIGAMLRYALGDPPEGLGLHAVHAGIDPENVASRRLVEKLGFTEDRSQRSHLQVGSDWRAHDFFVKHAA
ncbi:MAG: GNAT family N-acetyltransferase [Phycisphaerales bacterium JB059]